MDLWQRIVKYRYVDRGSIPARWSDYVWNAIGGRGVAFGKLAKDETACRFLPERNVTEQKETEPDHGKSFMRISDLASLCDAPGSRDEFTAENMSITWRDP